jgi:hypothetical protein
VRASCIDKSFFSAANLLIIIYSPSLCTPQKPPPTTFSRHLFHGYHQFAKRTLQTDSKKTIAVKTNRHARKDKPASLQSEITPRAVC